MTRNPRNGTRLAGKLAMIVRLLPSVMAFVAPILLAAGAAMAALPTVAPLSHSAVTVNTSNGPVRGFLRDGVSIFLGVPYAAPPIGERRWQPPAPAGMHGLLDATTFGSACPQSNSLAVFASGPSVEEDCLTLNIFTTGTGPSDDKLKPVIVWIHGGGNFTGASSDYDGSALAKGGPRGTPTVVVTLNYRLGLFGFFAHPALENESAPSINYGIMDQQAALRWVQANIGAFGGDPTRVAVAGQSAGAANTLAHVVSPLSKGLFNRAIVMSGPTIDPFLPLNVAMDRGRRFAVAVGCTGSDAAAARCLRRLSPARILQLQGTIKDYNGPYFSADQPAVDGKVIPMRLSEAYASDTFNHVPVMGGSTRDEFTFLIGVQQYFSGPPPGSPVTAFSDPPQQPLTAEEYALRMESAFGPQASRVLAQYPVAKHAGDPMRAYTRALMDPFQCTENVQALQHLARKVPTYGWIFTYQDAPFYMPQMPGFRALATHTIDIQFLFRGFHGGLLGVNLDQHSGMPRELNTSELQLSDQLIGFWTNFADRGNPNQPGRDDWPRLDPDSPRLLKQDIPLSTVTNADVRTQYHCDFWESLQRR